MNKVLSIAGLSLFLTTNLFAATTLIEENSVLQINSGGRYEVLAENKVENMGVITATGQAAINVNGIISNKGKIKLNDIANGENIKLRLDSEGIIEINNSVPDIDIPTVESIKIMTNGAKQTINTNLGNETIVFGNCEIGANTSIITERNGENAIFDIRKTDISGNFETDRTLVFE